MIGSYVRQLVIYCHKMRLDSIWNYIPCAWQVFPLPVGTMLHMTLKSMCGIHVTRLNLLTVTDQMFSSGYITAGADVIGPCWCRSSPAPQRTLFVFSSYGHRPSRAWLRHLIAFSLYVFFLCLMAFMLRESARNFRVNNMPKMSNPRMCPEQWVSVWHSWNTLPQCTLVYPPRWETSV